VDPEDEHSGDEQPAAPLTRTQRARARAAAVQERADRLKERAQAERAHHSSVDALFEIADRDSEVGGGILAGALAYRLFLALLPLALVAVAGLGVAASTSSTSPESAAQSLGLAGLVSHSIAGAAGSSARWYALLIGIPLVLMTMRSVLRALIVIHRLVWADLRHAAPKPTIGATCRFLAVIVAYFAVSALAVAARSSSGGTGLLVTLLIPFPYAALWLLISLRLPHRDANWRALVPGALLFGVGIEILHVVTAYYIAPEATKKQGTYGSLGLAAALLLGLYLGSRLMVASAVLNVTLWERRLAAAAPVDDTG
jgi:uncharacterized BrkB/YihY/UPF0761 family membrane protein